MKCPCTSETFISTTLLISPDLQYERSLYFWDISINTLLISPDLQDEFSLYFWDIPINTTTHLTWSTRWSVFVLLRHSYQHHYLISPDLQYGRSLYVWDISINTTTDLTWSTRWTVFPLLRRCYQHHDWSHLIYKIECLCSSEKFLSTPLLISPDLQDEMSFYFWDIPINTTTDLTWSTRWTVFVLLRHSYQHHYSSHLI